MGRANIPERYCSRNNTHCSEPHPCSHVVDEPSEKAAHQTTVSLPGFWPFPPGAPFNFKAKTSECTRKLMKWPTPPSSPARCAISALFISRNTNQGSKIVARELCDCVPIVLLETPLTYQPALRLSPPGVTGRMQAWRKQGQEERAGEPQGKSAVRDKTARSSFETLINCIY